MHSTLGNILTVEHKQKLSEAHKSSEKCRSWLVKLHADNKKSGRFKGKNNVNYIPYDQSVIDEIVSLYQKGWGHRRIHGYLTKIKGITITKGVILSRLRNSGTPLRKVLTNFDKMSTVYP